EIYPVRGFFALILPFMVVIYLGFLIGLRPPRPVVWASLAGGLLMAVINMLVDLLAYYAHWWHYTLNDLILHLPLPFYATMLLYYGSLVYLLIWRFWRGRGRWFALLLLIGTPLFGIARDLYGWLTQKAYTQWENVPAALAATIVMWLVMFYGGYWLFRRFAPARAEGQAAEEVTDKGNVPA
ncbi:MAG: hypothetical protein J2P36_28850, partial [Ktedonobacteraceae bacterium]|nr:hypothetical protein [Ktedonobacteraceae bacterium]